MDSFSLKASSVSGLPLINNPFNTEETANPVFIGSFYTNGFKPGESIRFGSIILTGI